MPTAAAEDARNLVRARHRLTQVLLRQGVVYFDGTPWTRVHDQWLRQVCREVFVGPGLSAAFDANYEGLLATLARRGRQDAVITAIAASSEFTP